MVQIIILIGFAFVLFIGMLAFTAAKESLIFYIRLRYARKRALRKVSYFLSPRNVLFGNLVLENEFCTVTIKQYQNQIVCMSKIFDGIGQKKVFIARCSVEKIWNADALFNVICNSFVKNTKYEEIRRAVIEYSVLEEQVYAKDDSLKSIETNKQSKKFDPKHENFKKVEKRDELFGSLIDVNTASEEELLKLPGITVFAVKKAINFRENQRLFASVDDFIEVLEIKPHFAKNLRNYICAMNFVQETAPSTNTSTVGEFSVVDNNFGEIPKDRILDLETSSNVANIDVVSSPDERVVDFD